MHGRLMIIRGSRLSSATIRGETDCLEAQAARATCAHKLVIMPIRRGQIPAAYGAKLAQFVKEPRSQRIQFEYATTTTNCAAYFGRFCSALMEQHAEIKTVPRNLPTELLRAPLHFVCTPGR